ncbi:MAG: HYR domain-containing protein, partial [Ruminiclostridium sp.]|nr:HYR domain-containing protein [Ruminiclostridium sp.]
MAFASELVATEVVADVSNAEIVVVKGGDSVSFNIVLSANGNAGTGNIVKIPTLYAVSGVAVSTSIPSSEYSFSGISPVPQTVVVTTKAEADAELGSYTVQIPITFVSSDKLKNETADYLTIRVVAPLAPADTTPPVIAFHKDVTAEATSAAGAIVTFTAPIASDNVDADFAATCDPASGTQFPLGSTTITCNATDAAGNAATPTTFTVTVVDTTVPVFTKLPSDQTVEATAVNTPIADVDFGTI